MLQRVDWRRDLHFQTRTTIDTLDYSGGGFNQGSKVVIAAVGKPCRKLPDTLPANLSLPDGFKNPKVVMPGVLAIEGPPFRTATDHAQLAEFCRQAGESPGLWVTFTRSNPATDIDGLGAEIQDKHWGCRGSLVIDARIKPHHAPPLIEDPDTQKKVDARAARGGALARYL